jgi:hypothetical protein
MRLLSPEKATDGFKIFFHESCQTPELAYSGDSKMWSLNSTWMAKTDNIRSDVLNTLYENRTAYFKTSPTLNTLDTLFMPWVVVNESGELTFKSQLPSPDSDKDGKGIIELVGIYIKKTGITPLWQIKEFTEITPVVDFEWSEAKDEECREITLIESELTAENTDDTLKLTTDEEYTTRKFAAKERVKEARLKAILARRAAEVETDRYYAEFAINDSESSFSEYDISDFSEEEEEENAS